MICRLLKDWIHPVPDLSVILFLTFQKFFKNGEDRAPFMDGDPGILGRWVIYARLSGRKVAGGGVKPSSVCVQTVTLCLLRLRPDRGNKAGE